MGTEKGAKLKPTSFQGLNTCPPLLIRSESATTFMKVEPFIVPINLASVKRNGPVWSNCHLNQLTTGEKYRKRPDEGGGGSPGIIYTLPLQNMVSDPDIFICC
jgi:hypothetical protein